MNLILLKLQIIHLVIMKKILLATETEKIYRYSNKSIYYIYNIFTDKLKKLTDEKVMYATFSPSGDKIAYVAENNIFIKNIINGEVIQVTYDGKRIIL